MSTSNTEDFLSQLHAEGFQAALEDLHALTAAYPELFFVNWPDDGDTWSEDGMDTIREQLTSVGARRATSSVYTLPAGTYVVGDPCYAIPQDRWMEWLGTDARSPVIANSIDGYTAIGFATAHGDGYYLGSDSNLYWVDAGLIGAVPHQITEIQPETPRVTQTYTFDKPFDCYSANGIIHIGHITIDTIGEDDEDPFEPPQRYIEIPKDKPSRFTQSLAPMNHHHGRSI